MDIDEQLEEGFLPWLFKTGHDREFANKTAFNNEIDLARHIYNSESARNTVKAYFEENKPYSICDADESNKLQKKADIVYKEHHDLEGAAVLYTKAIYRAPIGSQSLARAHANRAAILSKLQSYEAAYEDCTCAIEFNYSYMQPILSRQAKIAWKLKDLQKVQDCINRFRKFNINVPRTVQDFHEKLKQVRSLTKVSEDQIRLKLPKFNKIKLSRSPERGRFYIADEPIEAGECVLEDTAAVFVRFNEDSFRKDFLSTEENELVFLCDNCGEDDIVPFPCYKCRSVFYCSKKCREEHYPIHRFECGGYSIHLTVENPQHQLKLRFLLTIFDDILRKLQNTSKITAIHAADELWPILVQIAEDGELLSLYSNFQSLQKTGKAIFYALLGLLFCSYLADQTDFFECTHRERFALMPSEAEWHIVVIGLFLRSSSASTLNALAVNQLQAAKPFAAKTVSVKGLYSSLIYSTPFSAIYPWFSFFNHSCDSNTSLQMNNLKICIYSNRYIAKGEEVTVDYLLESAQLDREERKRDLEQYMICDCSRCNNDEDPILAKYMGIPCNCGGYCLMYDENPFCSKCGELSNLELYTFINLREIPTCPEAFSYLYGRCRILKKGLGNMGCGVLSQQAEPILEAYLKLTTAQILDDDVVNGLMVKLAVDLLEATRNPYVPPLNRAIYAAMLLDIVAMRKKKGFQPLHFDYKTIVEGAIWVVTGKSRKMFDEFCKLLCL